MRRAQLCVVWLAALGLAAALLFPPYGYRSVSITSIGKETSESTKKIAWTYVSHGFIFAQPPEPPSFDPIESKEFGLLVMLRSAEDYGISWAAVAAEIGSILALAFAAFGTLHARPDQSSKPAKNTRSLVG